MNGHRQKTWSEENFVARIARASNDATAKQPGALLYSSAGERQQIEKEQQHLNQDVLNFIKAERRCYRRLIMLYFDYKVLFLLAIHMIINFDSFMRYDSNI